MKSHNAMHPAKYRVYQFFVAVRAGLPGWAGGAPRELSAQGQALVSQILPTPAQQSLFYRMPPNDRRHAVAVAQTLRQAGHTNPALLQAALLHDAGKSIGQPIIHRVLIVLLEAFWPAALARLSRFHPTPKSHTQNPESAIRQIPWWRRPFVVHAEHPQIGATWAEQVQCDPLAVQLIRQHQTALPDELHTGPQKLLAALQWADNLN
ncbi:MAG: hypothetical protein D6768_18265 [Chloroflexi bacterium]|nr:MAG: hypothetical protein D6768_18265 [Chloroflexota bacterium]